MRCKQMRQHVSFEILQSCNETKVEIVTPQRPLAWFDARRQCSYDDYEKRYPTGCLAVCSRTPSTHSKAFMA
jgi:hypothetical protein